MGTRHEDSVHFDTEAYQQSQRFGGPAYGWNPDAAGARYEDAGDENQGDDFGFGRDESGSARGGDAGISAREGDLGSARQRGEAERVAWARPGSHNEERDLREWEDRANELGNDQSFRRRR